MTRNSSAFANARKCLPTNSCNACANAGPAIAIAIIENRSLACLLPLVYAGEVAIRQKIPRTCSLYVLLLRQMSPGLKGDRLRRPNDRIGVTAIMVRSCELWEIPINETPFIRSCPHCGGTIEFSEDQIETYSLGLCPFCDRDFPLSLEWMNPYVFMEL